MKMVNFSDYKIRNYNFKIIVLIAAICVIGYLVLTSAMVNDPDRDGNLQKQLIGIIVGAVFMIAISLIDYHLVLKAAPIIYIGVLVLLAGVLLFGKTINYATRWLDIAGFRIQPSEFAKIGVIVVFARYFDSFKDKINKPGYLFGALGLFAVIAGMVLLEPDLSTTLVILFIFLCMLFVAKLSWKWIVGAIAVAVPFAVTFVILLSNGLILEEYQRNRILSWLFPSEYSASGLTTQQDNSVLAISSGQLYGKGLNNTSFESVKNGNFLSEENSDFIFSVVGEELGFIGSVVVLLLIAFLVVECFKIGMKAKDMGGRLVAVGTGSLIAFQTFVNIGVATGLLPNTGLPLPFMSAGVSSALSLFIGMGIVLNAGLQKNNRDVDF